MIWPKDLLIRRLAHPAVRESLQQHITPLCAETKAGRVGATFLSVTSAKRSSAFPAKCAQLKGITLIPPVAAVSLAECHFLENGWLPQWKIKVTPSGRLLQG